MAYGTLSLFTQARLPSFTLPQIEQRRKHPAEQQVAHNKLPKPPTGFPTFSLPTQHA